MELSYVLTPPPRAYLRREKYREHICFGCVVCDGMGHILLNRVEIASPLKLLLLPSSLLCFADVDEN